MYMKDDVRMVLFVAKWICTMFSVGKSLASQTGIEVLNLSGNPISSLQVNDVITELFHIYYFPVIISPWIALKFQAISMSKCSLSLEVQGVAKLFPSFLVPCYLDLEIDLEVRGYSLKYHSNCFRPKGTTIPLQTHWPGWHCVVLMSSVHMSVSLT